MDGRLVFGVGLLLVISGCIGTTPFTSPDSPVPSTTRTLSAELTTTATDTPTETPTPVPGPSVTFIFDQERVSISVEIADTPEEHRQGLMGRESLAKNHGMLFVFETEQSLTFWMKNTSIPLDIIFIDGNGTVLNVEHASVQPNASDDELKRYHSDGKAKYVVEVNRGFANRTGLGPGAEMVINGSR